MHRAVRGWLGAAAGAVLAVLLVGGRCHSKFHSGCCSGCCSSCEGNGCAGCVGGSCCSAASVGGAAGGAEALEPEALALMRCTVVAGKEGVRAVLGIEGLVAPPGCALDAFARRVVEANPSILGGGATFAFEFDGGRALRRIERRGDENVSR